MLAPTKFKEVTSLTYHEWDLLLKRLGIPPEEDQLLYDAILIARGTNGWRTPHLTSKYRIMKFLESRIVPFQLDPMIRFRATELSASAATALLDITTTKLRFRPARADDVTAPGFGDTSGHKGVVFKYQVATTLQGTIIDVKGPMPGRRHDSFLFQPPFPYYRQDYVLLDGAYIKLAAPVRCPERKPVGKARTARAERFNRGHTKYRARIERMFGSLKERFPLLRETKFGRPVHGAFVKLICTIAHIVDADRNTHRVRYFKDEKRLAAIRPTGAPEAHWPTRN